PESAGAIAPDREARHGIGRCATYGEPGISREMAICRKRHFADCASESTSGTLGARTPSEVEANQCGLTTRSSGCFAGDAPASFGSHARCKVGRREDRMRRIWTIIGVNDVSGCFKWY